MSDKHASDALQALQRLRALEVRDAKADYATRLETLEARETEQRKVQTELNYMQTYVQDHAVRSTGIDVDALANLQRYTQLQVNVLSHCDTLIREAQHRAEEGRDALMQRHQACAVVERLQERRTQIAQQAAQSAEQRALDDQALIVESRRHLNPR